MKWTLWLILAAILWVLFFIFAMSSHAQTLTCTIPRYGQLRWTDPTYGADSMMIDCEGPDTTSVDSLILYRYQSGNFKPFRSYYVRGREGQPFTSDSLPPGQYTMTAKNGHGESCGGNIVTLGSTTGVEPGEGGSYDPVVSLRTYDIRGRLVRGKLAAGIYFVKETYRSGKVRTKRIAVVK